MFRLVVRFVIAEMTFVVVLFTGLDGPGPMAFLRGASLAIATVVAAFWALRRISGLAMLNCVAGATGLAVIATTSGPGRGYLYQYMVLTLAIMILGGAWIVQIGRAQAAARRGATPSAGRGFLVTPFLALCTLMLLYSGAPAQVRFAASKSELDAFAMRARTALSSTDIRVRLASSDVPDSLGGINVYGAAVRREGDHTVVAMSVAGDCGWFRTCLLINDPEGSEGRHLDPKGVYERHLGGDWYEGYE